MRAAGDDREEDLPVTPASELLDLLPVDEQQQRFRALVEVHPNWPPVLTLNVQEPLADDVRGQRNQYLLRTAAQVEEATQDSVFFRALYSEVANCNMLGVHHELGRRGTGLTRYWSVRDHSVPVPDGGDRPGRGHAGVAPGVRDLALRDDQRPPARVVHQAAWAGGDRDHARLSLQGDGTRVVGEGRLPGRPDQQLRPACA